MIRQRKNRRGVLARTRVLSTFLISVALASCASLQGYPDDPENTQAVLTNLSPYLNVDKETEYTKATDAAVRKGLRDQIVLSRMRIYQIEFDKFEKAMWSDGSSVSLGADLLALALGGIATTAQNASTKTAYAAATTGVVGGSAAINRDLYYQRTLPALIAQMEANRANVKLRLLAGLRQDDAHYSLPEALNDLADLKNAGGMPNAIGNIAQQAANEQQSAQDKIDALRTGVFSNTDTSKRIRAWLSNDPTGSNIAMLQKWMATDVIDPTLHSIPPEVFTDLTSPQLEADRVRAIAAFNIP